MRAVLLVLALCCMPLTAYALYMYAYTAWCLATPLNAERIEYYTRWNDRFAALAVSAVAGGIASLVVRRRLRRRSAAGPTARGETSSGNSYEPPRQ